MYEKRNYRFYSLSDDLTSFNVIYGETDLFISCDQDLRDLCEKKVKQLRLELNKYIAKNPVFETSFVPVRYDFFAPEIAKKMIKASTIFKVGPMAAVAGAFSDIIGNELLKCCNQIIVENGGDIFIKTLKPRKIGVFAGKSPFSEKIAIEIVPEETPVGICTSSGTVGHSHSFGKADAVVVKANTSTIADAAATAICNEIKSKNDIDVVIKKYSAKKCINGILIIKDDYLGVYGRMTMTKI